MSNNLTDAEMAEYLGLTPVLSNYLATNADSTVWGVFYTRNGALYRGPDGVQDIRGWVSTVEALRDLYNEKKQATEASRIAKMAAEMGLIYVSSCDFYVRPVSDALGVAYARDIEELHAAWKAQQPAPAPIGGVPLANTSRLYGAIVPMYTQVEWQFEDGAHPSKATVVSVSRTATGVVVSTSTPSGLTLQVPGTYTKRLYNPDGTTLWKAP